MQKFMLLTCDSYGKAEGKFRICLWFFLVIQEFSF